MSETTERPSGKERVRQRLVELLKREPTEDEMLSWADCRAREQAAYALIPIYEREGLVALELIAPGELARVAIDRYQEVMKELTS